MLDPELRLKHIRVLGGPMRTLPYRAGISRTDIVERTLSVCRNASVKGREFPPLRGSIRLRYWDCKTKSCQFPVALERELCQPVYVASCLCKTRTALFMMIDSGLIFVWMMRADAWRKVNPLHSCRIPFWICSSMLKRKADMHAMTHLDFVELH